MTKPDDTIRVLIPLNLKTAVTPQWQGLSGGFEGGLSALPADMWGRITISPRGSAPSLQRGPATQPAPLVWKHPELDTRCGSHAQPERETVVAGKLRSADENRQTA